MFLFIDKKLVKFLLVGTLNTFIGSLIMFALYNLLGASYWLSSALNYAIGGIVSFFLNKYFTFQNRAKSVKQVLFFVLNLAACYFVSYFFAKRLMFLLLGNCSQKWRENISLFVGMCFYTVLNYIGQRLFVFGERGN